MHLSGRVERAILIVISLALLLLIYLLYLRVRGLIESYQLVHHTTVVQTKLEQTLSSIKDAETAQRGFLLTRDSTFLQPMSGARRQADSLLHQIKQLTLDNPTQQGYVATLEYLINKRFEHLHRVLAETRANDGHVEMIGSRLAPGKALMDRIRKHMNLMMNVEADLLREREAAKNKYVLLTPLFVWSLMVLTLSALLFSFYRISYQLKVSRSYALQLKEKNEELALKNRQLENSNEELNSFNYIASHDLREPLRKIRTFNSLILQDPAMDHKMKQFNERIENSAGYMQSLLDDLLAYSRMSTDARKPERVDLMELLGRVEDNLKEALEENKALLEYSQLPVITGTSFQLQQLFENLISNSLKYREPGKPPHIRITSHPADSSDLPTNRLSEEPVRYIRIDFSDNGIGFDQKYAEKVFGLFQRLHTKKEYSGTGIGLTICKKVVENHGGWITVTSKENEGTTFHIFLPG